jgi:hypothetical protein
LVIQAVVQVLQPELLETAGVARVLVWLTV